MSRLLVIDDDLEFCELLSDFLKNEGFEVEVIHDGREGLQEASRAEGEYDLILLDIMLPGMNGFEILRHIRSRLNTPVLMLTARNQEVDRIVGLEIGADDFLVKPFNPRELVARVRAILRRTKPQSDGRFEDMRMPGKIVLGDIELDMGTRVVYRGGRRIELTAVEFNFLEMLLKAAGYIVTREQLSKGILGRSLTAYDRSLDVHVSNLRKKLGHQINGIDRIKTVRGIGYIYAVPMMNVQEGSMH